MKNLSRAFAVVIALTMVLSTVAFAAVFTDVKDDAAYAEAIELGVALNLFKGYEDGSFKPEGDITRAEFAAIVVRTLGQEAQATGAAGTTKFIDVPSTHWASGYVNIAANLGIINGYGDGNFGPEDKVTYEQAVKMVVVALGYEPAVGSAGYPVGYLTIAQQRGVTNGVKGTNGVPANRGQVAQMVFNALDVPLLEQTGFGTYVDYLVQDGTGDSNYKKTLLTEKLGIVKLKVMVKSSYEATSTRKNNIVAVTLKNVYKTKFDDDFVVDSNKDINVGTTNLKSLVGFNAILYVAFDETSSDEPVAVYAKKDIASADELVIASDDIETITPAAPEATDELTIAYWESDTARTTDKITIKNNAQVYINGYASDLKVKAALSDFYGEATFALLNKNTTADYDTLFITDYDNVIIDSVNTSTGRVSVKDNSARISFADDEKYSTSLFDENGKEIDWKTLKENDVLSVRIVNGSAKTIYMATLVNKSVTGVVTETSDDGYVIDGKEYEVDGNVVTSLKLEDEGTFYLDILGKITYADITSARSGNYAYIINAEPVTGIDSKVEVKMFTYKGEVVTLKTASKFKVYDVVGTEYKDTQYTSSSMTPAQIDALDGKFVTFNVNSSGEISKIYKINTLNEGSKDKDELTLYDSGDDATYTDSTKALKLASKRAYISDKTVIMHAPSDADADDDYETLVFEGDINAIDGVEVYDVDEDGYAGAIFITQAGIVDTSNGSTNIAVVTKQSTGKNSEGDTIAKYTVLQNGETIVIDGEDDSVIDKGTVIIPSKNSKGELKSYKEIAYVDGTTVEFGEDYDDVAEVTAEAKNDVVYYLGKATDIRNSILTVAGEDYSIPSNANVYVYDEYASTSNQYKVSDLDFINVFYKEKSDGKLYAEGTVDDEVEVYVLLREYESKIVDVVIYMFKK